MKAYMTYIVDDNNDISYCMGISEDKQAAASDFKTVHLKEFLQTPNSDICFIKFAEVEIEDREEDFYTEFDILQGVLEDAFDEEEMTELVNRIDQSDNTGTKILYSISGYDIGEALYKYYQDTTGSDYDAEDYMEFMDNFGTDDPTGYTKFVDDFIKQLKFNF